MLKEKLHYLNILKFLACIPIILLHYNDHFLPALGLENPFDPNSFMGFMTRNTAFFVEFFFMVSGILFFVNTMPKILAGEKFNHFLMKKVIRLYPVVIASTIITYIMDMILYFSYNGSFTGSTLSLVHLFNEFFFGDVLFTTGNKLNGPAWYVFVLMFVYVVAYILTKLYKKYPSKLLFVAPIFVGVCFYMTSQHYVLVSYSTARGLYSFFAGVLLGFFLNYLNNKYCGRFTTNRIILKVLLFIELVLVISFMFYDKKYLFITDYNQLFLIFFFPELVLFLFDFEFINKFGKTGFGKTLAGISYSVYLFDFAILVFYTTIMYTYYDRTIVFEPWFIIAIILTHLAVALISYYLIELKLGKKLKVLFANYCKKKEENIIIEN